MPQGSTSVGSTVVAPRPAAFATRLVCWYSCASEPAGDSRTNAAKAARVRLASRFQRGILMAFMGYLSLCAAKVVSRGVILAAAGGEHRCDRLYSSCAREI